jgi:hypothetical protein
LRAPPKRCRARSWRKEGCKCGSTSFVSMVVEPFGPFDAGTMPRRHGHLAPRCVRTEMPSGFNINSRPLSRPCRASSFPARAKQRRAVGQLIACRSARPKGKD